MMLPATASLVFFLLTGRSTARAKEPHVTEQQSAQQKHDRGAGGSVIRGWRVAQHRRHGLTADGGERG